MVRVRDVSESEAKRLQRIIRTGAENIVTWRRATVVLASFQGPEGAGHRQARPNLRGPRAGGDPQLQRGRDGFTVPEVE